MSALFKLRGRVSWMVPMLLTMALVFGLTAFTQNGTEPNEGCELIPQNTPGEFELHWWGKSGRTYFIQCSEDLETWMYAPFIESGLGEATAYAVQVPGAMRFFLRLKYTDVPTGPDPGAEDFDTDDLSSMDELTLYNTDPLNADTDDDGYSDGLEVRVGSSPTLMASTPIEAVAAQLAAVQSAITAYQALTQSGAGYAEVLAAFNSLKDQIDDLQENLDDIDEEVPGSPTGPTRESANDAEDDLGEEPVEPPSTAVLQARWFESNYSGLEVTAQEQLWMWTGGAWSRSGDLYSNSYSVPDSGDWFTFYENGTNSSVIQAMSASASLGDFVDSSTMGLSASAHYDVGTATGGGPPVPSFDGSEEGQTTTTYGSSTVPNTYLAQTREFRIRRSDEGDPDTVITQSYLKTVSRTGFPDTHEVITLNLPAGAGTSSETLTLTAQTTIDGTTHTESATAMGLVEVGFSGDDAHTLNADTGNKVYGAPHWVDANGDGSATVGVENEKNYPIAFRRGGVPKLNAKILIPGVPEDKTVSVMATILQQGGGNLQLPATQLTRSPDGVTFTLSPTATSAGFENAVRCYNGTAPDEDPTGPLKIEWQVKVGSANFHVIGTSRHTVYLTYKKPDSAVNKETLFYIGSRYAPPHPPATPAGEDSVVDGIYNHFKTLQVFKVKPSTATPQTKAMTYWKTGKLVFTTDDLLKERDGRCNSWASLFRDVLAAQGIESAIKSITPKPINRSAFDQDYDDKAGLQGKGALLNPVTFLLVKNWQSPGSDTFGNPSAFWPTDLAGVPAQGENNGNPWAAFREHAVVKCGTRYFDPSYGSEEFTSATFKDWENASLGGVAASFDGGSYPSKNFFEPGFPTPYHLWFEKPNGLTTEECILQQ